MSLQEKKKEQVKAGIKKGLEGLAGQIPGLIEVKSKNRVSSKFYSRCNVRHNI